MAMAFATCIEFLLESASSPAFLKTEKWNVRKLDNIMATGREPYKEVLEYGDAMSIHN